MPTFSPEQYQFIGWFFVTVGGAVLAGLMILRKLGFEMSLPKRNGTATAAPAAVPSQVSGNGQIQSLANNVANLSKDHERQGVILGKLADARVETKTLLREQLEATKEQTALLRDRLPPR